jgi:hypothetical protein
MRAMTVGVPVHGGDMTGQLELIGTPKEWELDDSARDAGRRGVERARAALSEARRHLASGEPVLQADRRADQAA